MNKGIRPSVNAEDIKVGRRLRQIRKAKGLHLNDLANSLKISYQQVQKYERGQNRVSAVRLNQFMKILGAPWTHFFDDSQGKVLGVFQNYENIQSINKLWKELPEDLRICLYVLIAEMNEVYKKDH